jgi:hypothetical protein
LSDLKKALKAEKDVAVKKAQKAYELFCCCVAGKAQANWDRIVNEMLGWECRRHVGNMSRQHVNVG